MLVLLAINVARTSYGNIPYQGWRQEFSDRGMTLPTRGLKYDFQGIVNAKSLRQNSFSPSDRGLECFDRGAIASSSPPLAPPLFYTFIILFS